jgi:hypothetical protein
MFSTLIYYLELIENSKKVSYKVKITSFVVILKILKDLIFLLYVCC